MTTCGSRFPAPAPTAGTSGQGVEVLSFTEHDCAALASSGVIVDLEIDPGQAIDVADIERCMEHTAQTISS